VSASDLADFCAFAVMVKAPRADEVKTRLLPPLASRSGSQHDAVGKVGLSALTRQPAPYPAASRSSAACSGLKPRPIRRGGKSSILGGTGPRNRTSEPGGEYAT
jgi:hypothetical protein